MNEAFGAYISAARDLATIHGVRWDIPVNGDGTVDNDVAWDITAICGAAPPPRWRLNNLGCDTGTLAAVNERLTRVCKVEALSVHWQDLIKAAVVYQALAERNTPAHIVGQVSRSLRVLGTCAWIRSGLEPWKITIGDIRWTLDIAGAAQKSGKLRLCVAGVVRSILDVKHLCDNGPFAGILGDVAHPPRGKSTHDPAMLSRLEDRAAADKLPEADALWELVEIVFTKQPQTFVDCIRFAQLRVQMLCGLRVGEVCNIPAQWNVEREHLTLDGRPAGDVGGISNSLLLRHFAEKQSCPDDNSVLLVEAFQHVPAQFEEIIRTTMRDTLQLTNPLRNRLRQQIETGRMFPEYARDDLVHISDMYTRLTGNPVLRQEVPPGFIIDDYRSGFELGPLRKIAEHQRRSSSGYSYGFLIYWARWAEADGAPPLRHLDGSPDRGRRRRLSKCHLRVGEVEDFLARSMPTKLSDVKPLRLVDGSLPIHDLLFLVPKRALSEGRNDGVCDVSKYFSVGRVTPDDVQNMLGGLRHGLFARYGETGEARALTLKTHALRHLQNTVLFQTGISDAAITKRFNRKSVAQSYEYDHRTLAQQLQAMDLPPAAQGLPDKTKTVARMIMAGKARGTVVDEFKRIQQERGDQHAFDFLAAEADGFHATPYGFCINGFTQSPCPKHLQCFDGCNHFLNSGLDRNQANLERLLANSERTVEEISQRKGGIGRDNQLRHARKLVANIRKALETPDGKKPFAAGEDLFRPLKPRTALDD